MRKKLLENMFINFLLRLLPDWKDPESTREFVLKFLGFAASLAQGTATTADDKLVVFMQKIAGNAESWSNLHGLLLILFAGEDLNPEDGRIYALADEVEMDPATVVMIIGAIYQLIKLWRNRHEGSDAMTFVVDSE